MPDQGGGKSSADSAGRLSGAPLSDQTSFLLARANARSLTLGNAALVSLGLKVRSYSVLALAAGDEQPSQRDLASFLGLDPSQVVALVDDLQARGLVERVPDPTDRRANVVRATASGADLASKAELALRAVQGQVFDGLDAQQRETLQQLLAHVALRRDHRGPETPA